MTAHSESFMVTLSRLTGSSAGLFRKPSAGFVAWLQKKRIPAWLRQHLTRYALARDMEIGVIRLYSPSNLRASNDQFPIMVRRGFLQIGSATNGDPVAVRFRGERAVGYLSHDELWTDEPEDPADYFLPLASDIDGVVALAVQIEKCPLDYYGTMVEVPNKTVQRAGASRSGRKRKRTSSAAGSRR
jgi:hypothetical protein